MRFKDRTQAGKLLARVLEKYKNKNEDIVVFALPRGGVVVAVEIAKKLHAPLDLIIPRKIGHPLSPEYAIAAVAENGHVVANEEEIASVDSKWLKKEINKQRAEAQRRRLYYLENWKQQTVKGKTAILVDDGLATGLTMEVAIKELKHKNPKKIIVAVPVAPKETAERIKKQVDDFVCLNIPENFLGAVGAYYDSFPQVDDEKVKTLMEAITA